MTGQGDRNGRIFPNHLPGCQRSSSFPLAAFGCLEFAVDCRQAAKGLGEMNMCTEKWPEFICCDRNGAALHRRQSLPTALGWRSSSWFNQSSAGLYPSLCTLLEITFPTAASVEQICGLASDPAAPSLIHYPKPLERMVKTKILSCREANTLLLSLSLLWDSGTVGQ